MDHQISEKEIAKMLLQELDVLVEYWLRYFRQIGKDVLSSFDGFASFSYVDVNILKDALNVLNLIFENTSSANLPQKMNSVDQEFTLLLDPFGEYLDWSPNEINEIAYSTYACFEHRVALFIDFDKEKLSYYLDLVQKDRKDYLLWEEKKGD